MRWFSPCCLEVSRLEHVRYRVLVSLPLKAQSLTELKRNTRMELLSCRAGRVSPRTATSSCTQGYSLLRSCLRSLRHPKRNLL